MSSASMFTHRIAFAANNQQSVISRQQSAISRQQ
jgi:hypothetical protein